MPRLELPWARISSKLFLGTTTNGVTGKRMILSSPYSWCSILLLVLWSSHYFLMNLQYPCCRFDLPYGFCQGLNPPPDFRQKRRVALRCWEFLLFSLYERVCHFFWFFLSFVIITEPVGGWIWCSWNFGVLLFLVPVSHGRKKLVMISHFEFKWRLIETPLLLLFSAYDKCNLVWITKCFFLPFLIK